jgi:glucosamine kinase
VAAKQYRLGIDGGGTGCRARLADTAGKVLGEGVAGPANLLLGSEVSLDAVLQATHEALAAAGLPPSSLQHTHAGLGLAGANMPEHRRAFERLALPFARAALASDAEIACLGAHAGGDGAILILGTGSQGIVHTGGRFSTVGGWGFAVSDTGSGASLGRAAVRRALLAHEGVEPASDLTAAIMQRFDSEPTKMVEWAASAKPRDWAAFARMVFEHVQRGDPVAAALAAGTALEAERLVGRLAELGARSVCLMGGLAACIAPLLPRRFDALLASPRGDALDGALRLAL